MTKTSIDVSEGIETSDGVVRTVTFAMVIETIPKVVG